LSRKGKLISIVAVLALVASLLAVFPASVAVATEGTVELLGGADTDADGVADFFSTDTSKGLVTVSIVDADLSPQRTGIGRFTSGTAQTAIDLTDTAAPELFFLEGEQEITEVFTVAASAAAGVCTTATASVCTPSNQIADADADGDYDNADVTAISLSKDINTGAGPTSVVVGTNGFSATANTITLDNTGSALEVGDEVTITYEFTEYSQGSPTTTPVAAINEVIQSTTVFAVVSFETDGNPVTVATALTNATATKVTFAYDAKDTASDVQLTTTSATAGGKARTFDAVQTGTAVSPADAMTQTLGLVTVGDLVLIESKIATPATDDIGTELYVALCPDNSQPCTDTNVPLEQRDLATKLREWADNDSTDDIGVPALTLTSLATALRDLLLPVADGDSITATFVDEVASPGVTRTVTATADLTAPTITIVSPADDAFISDPNPTLIVDGTDSAAGIPVADLNTLSEFSTSQTSPVADGNVLKTGITDGFRFKFTETTVADGTALTWGLVLSDAVGNTSGTATDFTVNIDTSDPDILTALTGIGVVDGAEVTGVDTGIKVTYDDPVDPATVSASDYDVTGASAPSAAQVFDQLLITDTFTASDDQVAYTVTTGTPIDVDADEVFTDDVSATLTRTVTITATDEGDADALLDDLDLVFSPIDVTDDGQVDSDDVTVTVNGVAVEVTGINADIVELALVPAANPLITYTSDPGILSVSGTTVTINPTTASLVDAGDVVALTYTFDTSRFVYLTVGTLATSAAPTVQQVDAVADKAGNTTLTDSQAGVDRIAPSFTITGIPSGSAIFAGDEEEVTLTITSSEVLAGTPTVTVGGFSVTPVTALTGTTFEATFTAGTGNFTTSGIYAVEVTANDAAANSGTGAGEVELDLAAPGVTFDPEDEGTAFRSLADIARVTVTYDDADEYFQDERDTVTVTSSTLDGVDVTLFTTDNIVFSLGGVLDLGAHTLVVTAEDAAGNSTTSTVDFTVAEPPAIDIGLEAGWNLISVPGGIADPSVGSVFAGTNVTKVFTWDPVRFWTAAILNEDTGQFEGSLITISASNGYWVFTDRFEAFTVTLAKRGPTTAIPAYALTAGFNLIGFTSIAADPNTDSRLDESVPAGDYLASLGDTVTTVIGFNPAVGFEVDPANMVMGRAYWVFLSEDGTLIPGGG